MQTQVLNCIKSVTQLYVNVIKKDDGNRSKLIGIQVPDVAATGSYYEAFVRIVELDNGNIQALYGGTRKINPHKNFETVVTIPKFEVGQEVNLRALAKTLLASFAQT